MIDICAVGPLPASPQHCRRRKIKAPGGEIVIPSRGGSVAWRVVQNPTGHDYGHHALRCASTWAVLLLAAGARPQGRDGADASPRFNKTGMSAKYEHIWEWRAPSACFHGRQARASR